MEMIFMWPFLGYRSSCPTRKPTGLFRPARFTSSCCPGLGRVPERMEVQLDGSVTAVSDLGAQELPALEWSGGEEWMVAGVRNHLDLLLSTGASMSCQ